MYDYSIPQNALQFHAPKPPQPPPHTNNWMDIVSITGSNRSQCPSPTNDNGLSSCFRVGRSLSNFPGCIPIHTKATAVSITDSGESPTFHYLAFLGRPRRPSITSGECSPPTLTLLWSHAKGALAPTRRLYNKQRFMNKAQWHGVGFPAKPTGYVRLTYLAKWSCVKSQRFLD